MRFTCDTNELNTALSIVSRALAVRSTKPILEGILFESCDEGLRLTCTDLALGIDRLGASAIVSVPCTVSQGTGRDFANLTLIVYHIPVAAQFVIKGPGG